MTTTELTALCIEHIESEAADFWAEDTFDTRASRLAWLREMSNDLVGEHSAESTHDAEAAAVYELLAAQEPRIKAWNAKGRAAYAASL
jgi:hypothetical protein